jgi:hypothetical protein
MANRIVGKLGIKVMPDLTSFRSDLKAKLQAIQDEVKAEIKANLNLDKAKFLADVKAATEEARLEVESVKTTIKINLDPQTARFLAQTKAALNEIDKQAVKVPVVPETLDFRTKLAAELNAIRETMKAKIPTEPADLEEYKAKLRLAVLEASKTIKASIKTDVDSSTLKKFSSAFQDVVKAVGGAESVFDTVANDTKNLSKSLGDSEGLFSSIASGIGEALASMGPAIAAVAAAVAVLLIPAIGAATIVVGGLEAALLAIPGVIGIGIGAALVSFIALEPLIKGVQAGLSNTKKGTDAYNKAMAGLAPNTRLAVEAILSAKDAFKELRGEVQDNFFAGFSTDLQGVLQRLIPGIKSGLNNLALSIGHVIDQFVQWAGSTEGIKQINQLLLNTSSFFDALSPVVKPVVDAFTTLANLGITQLLTPLVSDLSGVAQKFDDFLHSGQGKSELADAFSNLKDLLEGVGSVITNLGADILKAFASKDAKQAIKEIGDDLNGLVQALGGSKGLTGTVKNLNDTLVLLNATLKNFPGGGGGLGQFINFLYSVTGPNGILFLAAGSIQLIKDTFDSLSKQLSKDFDSSVWKGLGDLLGLLGGFVVSVGIQLIAGIIKDVSSAVGGFNATNLIDFLDKDLPNGVQTVLHWIGQFIDKVTGMVAVVQNAPGQMLNALNPLQSGIPNIFTNAMNLSSGALTNGLGGLIGTLSGKLGVFLGVARGLPGPFGAVFSQAMGSGNSATSAGMNNIVGTIRSKVGAAEGAARSVGNAIIGGLSWLGSAAFGIGSDIISGLVGGIQARLGEALSVAENLGNEIAAATSRALNRHSPSKVFIAIGEDVVKGLVIGISDNTPSAALAATGLASAAIVAAQAVANNGVVSTSAFSHGFGGIDELVGAATNDRPIIVQLDGKKVGYGVLGGDKANARRG